MRRRRKHNACLNCGYPLNSEIYNYCPSCGQENTDTNISFSQLLYDFFNNAFSFDSRFINSIIPFFFKPGWLTNRFNEGKRASFANPLRLYLVISLFFFFVVNMVGKKIAQGIEESIAEESVNPDGILSFGPSIVAGSDSLYVMDSLDATLDDLKKQGLKISAIDSSRVKDVINSFDPIRVSTSDDGDNVILGIDWAIYNRLKDNRQLTDEMIFDSLSLGDKKASQQFIARQIIRVNRADKQTLVDFVANNLPILMFVMLPFFALLLKLLYIRRNILYVNHMIHAIHLHSFAYILYGVCMILLLMNESEGSFETWVIRLGFLTVSVYAFASFKRVYQQGWLKTLTKFVILGWTYVWCLGLGVVAEMVISFLIF